MWCLNHLEDRLLDQAEARTPYTPPPQGMILDVQRLVKSLFCPPTQSANGFFDFEVSIPLKLDTFFFGGGVEKFVVRRM